LFGDDELEEINSRKKKRNNYKMGWW